MKFNTVSCVFVGRFAHPGYFAELALHSAMTLALCFVSNLTAVVLIVTFSLQLHKTVMVWNFNTVH